MSILTIVFASFVAFEHFYIFYLESVATHSASTSRIFNMDQEELIRPSVTVLFKNQGIYNALIGVFLLYGLFIAKNSEIVAIFLLFIIGVAAYGAVTSNKKIILTQGGPAIVAIASLLLLAYLSTLPEVGEFFHSFSWVYVIKISSSATCLQETTTTCSSPQLLVFLKLSIRNGLGFSCILYSSNKK